MFMPSFLAYGKKKVHETFKEYLYQEPGKLGTVLHSAIYFILFLLSYFCMDRWLEDILNMLSVQLVSSSLYGHLNS